MQIKGTTFGCPLYFFKSKKVSAHLLAAVILQSNFMTHHSGLTLYSQQIDT